MVYNRLTALSVTAEIALDGHACGSVTSRGSILPTIGGQKFVIPANCVPER